MLGKNNHVNLTVHVIIRVHVSVFHDFKTPKGESAARARSVLIVKTLIMCTLSIIVSNLFSGQTSFCLVS